mmetsp:Transcript_27039/g.40676  ORF Transcript_27039/g.40676 Transcript_27039/m.40676 type:complete len:443 (+) Transcript_27039:47-1375(+)
MAFFGMKILATVQLLPLTLLTMPMLLSLLGTSLALWGAPVSAFPTFSSSMTARSAPIHRMRAYSAEWIDLQSLDASPPPGKIHPPRSGANTISSGGKILTFAGYAEEIVDADSGVERYVVNDLYEFVPFQEESSEWGWKQRIAASDDECSPGPRLAFAMAGLPSSPNAFVLGGWDPQVPGTGGVILDDVAMLNSDSLTWSKPTDDKGKSSTIPDGPTSRHVAVALSDETICLHNHRCVDHVLLLQTSGEEQNKVQWVQQKTSGDAPSSRGLHCAAVMSSSDGTNMCIFGGAAQNGLMSNEAFVLDTTTWKWTKIDCGENAPAPRAGACLCSLDDSTVLLFGGAMPTEGGLLGLNDVWVLHVDDLETGKGRWECLIEHDSGDNDGSSVFPPGRNAATLTEIDARTMLPGSTCTESDKCYLLQGGWAPFRKTYNDVFVLRISSK